MASRLNGAKPLSKPVMSCYQLDPRERKKINEILIKIHKRSLNKIHLKMSSANSWPYCRCQCVKFPQTNSTRQGLKRIVYWHLKFPLCVHTVDIHAHFVCRCLSDNQWRNHDDVIKWNHFPHYWPFVVTGGFPSQRPMTQSFYVFFVERLNKQLTKQSRRRRFESPSRSLWRHCNVTAVFC